MDAVSCALIAPGQGTPEDSWLSWPGLLEMPAITLEELVPEGRRVLVVAPHPDDEVLVAGGLLALLARRGDVPQVLAITDGTASHPGSEAWPVARLAQARPRESLDALTRLGLPARTERLRLHDGSLQRCEARLAERLSGIFRRDDVVLTTWRFDGHPDHEAAGRACALAAGLRGARLIESPVWAWHWAHPADPRLPWHRARRLVLDAEAVSRKQHALGAFESQLRPDPSTGAAPVIRPSMVARCARDFEVFLP